MYETARRSTHSSRSGESIRRKLDIAPVSGSLNRVQDAQLKGHRFLIMIGRDPIFYNPTLKLSGYDDIHTASFTEDLTAISAGGQTLQ